MADINHPDHPDYPPPTAADFCAGCGEERGQSTEPAFTDGLCVVCWREWDDDREASQ